MYGAHERLLFLHSVPGGVLVPTPLRPCPERDWGGHTSTHRARCGLGAHSRGMTPLLASYMCVPSLAQLATPFGRGTFGTHFVWEVMVRGRGDGERGRRCPRHHNSLRTSRTVTVRHTVSGVTHPNRTFRDIVFVCTGMVVEGGGSVMAEIGPCGERRRTSGGRRTSPPSQSVLCA